MIFDTDRLLHITKSYILRVSAGTLLVIVCFSLFFTHSIYASDAECADNSVEGLATACKPFLDPVTNDILPAAKYYKCIDTIQCDIPNTNRCCIEPEDGSYGGFCLDPKRDRKSLGVQPAGISIANMRPKACNIDEDAISTANSPAYVTTDPDDNLTDLFSGSSRPTAGRTEGGFPIREEAVIMVNSITKKPKAITWFYEERSDGTRGYYINPPLDDLYMINDLFPLQHQRTDPREGGSSSSNPLKNLGCKIINPVVNLVQNGISALVSLTTNRDNLPEIALLCAKGTPVFEDPSLIQFQPNGEITGFASTSCYCSDLTSGPATSAVLLCTRYIAGLGDEHAPWRTIVPVPVTGSGRFTNLLYGGPVPTDNIDELHTRMKQDIKDFFDPATGEVEVWVQQLADNSTLIADIKLFTNRFFGGDTIDPAGMDYGVFRSNTFVRQYISCLACAKYGGFPSALGCMPMEKADRFLGEGVLGIGISFAGAFSVLCIIFGAIQFQLSGGESAKVQKAQKLITQCVLGLLIILFSIFLLRFVGVNLLRIYGLG